MPEPVPEELARELPEPLLLFDGYCNLCNASVDRVIRADDDAVFTFAPLSSDTGQAILQATGLDGIEADSLVLVTDAKAYTRSSAVLHTAKRLGWPWRLAAVFWIVPTILRDAVYRWVARNRYGWFGKRETCRIPTPEEQARFLD